MGLTTYRIDREGATRLLFLFHGWSAEQHHLAAYVPLVDPDERFTAICPRGVHDMPEGDGASWYDRGSQGPDPVQFRQTLEMIETLIGDEVEKAGVTTEQCVIGGFSQGGFLTLELTGRAGAPRYAGAWIMCCGLHQVEGVEMDLEAGRGTPVLVQYGENDTIIPPDVTRGVAKTLGETGWAVTEAGYDMAHSQSIEMMADARDWLAGIV